MGTKRTHEEIVHFTKLKHIWWGARTPTGQRRYDHKAEIFERVCRPRKNFTILEIGCGDGEFTKRLAPIGARIIATDLTPEVIKRGKRQVPESNVTFRVENAEQLSFKNGAFDIVCGVSILHHLETEKALREGYRVLKKGGQLFFTEPNLLNPHVFLGLHIPLLRRRMEFSPYETALVRWKVKKMLREIGFHKVSVKNYDFLHPKIPKFAIQLAEKLSTIFEKTPLIQEISGSLLIHAVK